MKRHQAKAITHAPAKANGPRGSRPALRKLRDDETRHSGGRDTGERIRECPRDRDGGIGERRRGGEPIGRRDVEPDRERHGRRRAARGSRRSSAAVRTSRPLPQTIARCRCGLSLRQLPDRQLEHHVRGQDAGDAARDLRRRHRPAASRHGSSPRSANAPLHRRIEMRAGHRAEYQDQDRQHRAGRDRIAQQRNCAVAARQPAAMMPEPTTAASRKAVPSELGRTRVAAALASLGSSAFAVAPHAADLLAVGAAGESRSRLASGRAVKTPMRCCSIR